jgi:SSS family solute:Na+ symporter
VTIAMSLATRPRPPQALRGLVYGLTSKPTDDVRRWYERPVSLALVVLAGAVVLNVIFF